MEMDGFCWGHADRIPHKMVYRGSLPHSLSYRTSKLFEAHTVPRAERWFQHALQQGLQPDLPQPQTPDPQIGEMRSGTGLHQRKWVGFCIPQQLKAMGSRSAQIGIKG